MARIIREERRQRGLFGWIVLLLFWGFNAYMLYGLAAEINAVSHSPTPDTEAGRAGAAIGTGLGVGVILFVWVVGAIILGLMALLTRGKTVVIERAPAGVVAADQVDTSKWSAGDQARYVGDRRPRSDPPLAPPRLLNPPRPPLRRKAVPPPILAHTDDWRIEIVGEASYQDTIAEALQHATVRDGLYLILVALEPETDNPHDPDAVRVAFEDRTIGFLKRSRAKDYRKALGDRPSACTGAIFSGGEDPDALMYGVWLNIDWPPRFR